MCFFILVSPQTWVGRVKVSQLGLRLTEGDYIPLGFELSTSVGCKIRFCKQVFQKVYTHSLKSVHPKRLKPRRGALPSPSYLYLSNGKEQERKTSLHVYTFGLGQVGLERMELGL